jgi:hypothetical protein
LLATLLQMPAQSHVRFFEIMIKNLEAQFPVTVPIKCSNGSECISTPLSPPPLLAATQDLTFIYVGVGLAAGLIAIVAAAIIGSCIFSICETKIVRKQYEAL